MIQEQKEEKTETHKKKGPGHPGYEITEEELTLAELVEREKKKEEEEQGE